MSTLPLPATGRSSSSSSSPQQLLVLVAGAACLQAFLQSNWTGPGAAWRDTYAALQAALLPDGSTLPADTTALDALAVDGETVYRLLAGPWLLVAAKAWLIDAAPALDALQVRPAALLRFALFALGSSFAHERVHRRHIGGRCARRSHGSGR